jgi:hypothetical protein
LPGRGRRCRVRCIAFLGREGCGGGILSSSFSELRWSRRSPRGRSSLQRLSLGYSDILRRILGRAYKRSGKPLAESGYLVGKNVVIEYRLPGGLGAQPAELAADLVHRQVTVIVAMPAVAVALAAKSATDRIPIVFNVGADPVGFGLVDSLSRPGGNLTGVISLNAEVGPKRREVLHQVVPTVTSLAHLINPANPTAATVFRELQEAARIRGLRVHVFHASSEAEIDAAFASLAELRVGGLVISPTAFSLGSINNSPLWRFATQCPLHIPFETLL